MPNKVGRRMFVSSAPAEYDPAKAEEAHREQLRGRYPAHEARVQVEPPGRECSHPYTETDQRKPYIPVDDGPAPSLDEGVAFRQKLDSKY